MLSAHRVNSKLLESLIGRLNHVANILPALRHFMGQLRHALLCATKHKWTCLRMCK